MKKKTFKIFWGILATVLIAAAVTCAIVFSLPKKEKDPANFDRSNFLLTKPVNNDAWIDSGNFTTKIDGKNISGNGTEKSPYKIYTAEGLSYFAHLTNNETSTVSILSGTYIELANDIDLSAHYWTPIAANPTNDTGYFYGNFDGKGHKIYGMFMKESVYSGLIGYAKGSTIKNLSVMNGNFTSNSLLSSCIGGIVGMLENGTISSCNNYVQIEGASGYIGGIAGRIKSSKIENSINYANVKGSLIGGLVGQAEGIVEISSSVNTGVLTVDSIRTVGGLIGKVERTETGKTVIRNSANLGQMSNSVAGGLIGSTDENLEISQSYSINAGVPICNVSYNKDSTLKLVDVANLSSVSDKKAVLNLSVTADAKVQPEIISCYSLYDNDKASNVISTGFKKKENLSAGFLDGKFMTSENWSSVSAWSSFRISASHYPMPLNSLANSWNYFSAKPEGDGSENSPFLIKSAGNLGYISGMQKLNSEFATGKFFKVVNDIDLAGHEFEPIQNFKGYLDGTGKTISNMKIVKLNESSNVGFISEVSGNALIKNVSINDVDITGRTSVGALVGGTGSGAENIVIENCKVSGNIISSEAINAIYSGYVGGIIGSAKNCISLKIENCSANVNITSCGLSTAYRYAGGIVGYADGIVLDSEKKGGVSVFSCETSGKIKTTKTAGGIVGGASSCDLKIEKCFSSVEIEGKDLIGGLVGQLQANGDDLDISTEIVNNVVKTKITTTATVNVASLVGNIGTNISNANLKNNVAIAEINLESRKNFALGELFLGGDNVDIEGSYAHIKFIDKDGLFSEVKKIYLKDGSKTEEIFDDYFAFDKIGGLPAPDGIIGQGGKLVDVLQELIAKGYRQVLINE